MISSGHRKSRAVLAAALLCAAVAAVVPSDSTSADSDSPGGVPNRYQFMVGSDVPEGLGPIGDVADLSASPDGTIYLLERSARVLRLSQTGHLLNAWGSGTLRDATAIAVGPGATVHVADSSRRSIMRFSAWGALLGEWPLEESPTRHECFGDDSVSAMAFGRDGELLVATGTRIGVLDESGSCSRSWTVSEVPRALAVDAQGMVFAALPAQTQIEVYDSGGRLIDTIGRLGSGPGEFDLCVRDLGFWGSYKDVPCGPAGLAFAADGTLLATDMGNQRLQRLGSDGTYLGEWAISAPKHLAVGVDGTVLVTNGRSLEAHSPDGVKLGRRTDGAALSRSVQEPQALAIGPAGDVYIADTGNHRVIRLAADGRFETAFGAEGWGPDAVDTPVGIAVATDGTIVVADAAKHRLQRFDEDGSLLDVIYRSMRSAQPFDAPRGVDIGADGDLYVAESGRSLVLRLSPDGRFKREFGRGELDSPADVVVADDGSLWVADTGNDRVVRLSASGAVTGVWGESGSGPGQFRSPSGIDVDDSGVVTVADSGNSRLQRFASEDRSADDFEILGGPGCGSGQFSFPADVALAPDGGIFVADADNGIGVSGVTWDEMGAPSIAGTCSDRSGHRHRHAAICRTASRWRRMVWSWSSDGLLRVSGCSARKVSRSLRGARLVTVAIRWRRHGASRPVRTAACTCRSTTPGRYADSIGRVACSDRGVVRGTVPGTSG